MGAGGDQRMVHDQCHVPAVGMVELGREIEVGAGQIAVGTVLSMHVRVRGQMTEADDVDEDQTQAVADVEAVRAGTARRRHARDARGVALEELALGQPIPVDVVAQVSDDDMVRPE
ncbi:MAG: hypothetical protein E4H03_08265 [Myxococcales bacterium]|nr:MAG: hypothetical protein E4H03_08265 [Myxococcales bacterium]